MTNPAAIEYTSFFAKGQAAVGTAATLANSDAICLLSASITEAGTRGIERTDVQCGYGGAKPPVQGDRYFELTITAELVTPDTKGDSTDWGLEALIKACTMDVTDNAAVSVVFNRTSATVPLTDWIPLTFEGHVRNGLRRKAHDVMLALTKITATAGERIILEFAGSGKWNADAASTLTAPAPATSNLPIVAMNGSLTDGLNDESDFGWTLETGMTVKPLKDSKQTWGWGIPIGIAEGACVFTYTAMATTDFEGNRANNTSMNITAVFSTVSLFMDAAYIINIDASETDGAQTYDLTTHCVYTSAAAPDWTLTLT